MQQCNICSSNPKNKIYNYQMFEQHKDQPNKKYTSIPGVLIEGLEVGSIDAANRDITEFNNVYATYIKCSIPNKAYCNTLQTKYDDQSKIVSELEPAYNANKIKYDTCMNNKTKCEGINAIIRNSQLKINDFNDNINKKQAILDTCSNEKIQCDIIQSNNGNVEALIKGLTERVALNETHYKTNKCEQI